jgi:hypothetical protein
MVVGFAGFLMRPAPAISRAQFEGSDFQVNSHTTNAQWYPAVAGGPDGNFLVVWTSRFQDSDPETIVDVFGQRYDGNGAALGVEFCINTYTPEGQSNPVVATAADGSVVAAWVSYAQDGSASGIFARRFTHEGNAVGSEFQVNEYTLDAQERPAVASNAEGTFMVVWQSRQPPVTGSVEIFARMFDSAGMPLGSEFQVNTYTTKSQLDPKVCSGESGDFVVVWQSGATFDSPTDQDGSGAGIFGRKFDALGVPHGGEFQIAEHTLNGQVRPAVACAPGGEFVVVWVADGPSGEWSQVFSRRFGADAVETGPQQHLSTLTLPDVSPILLDIFRKPEIAYGQDGTYLVVWSNPLSDSFEEVDDADAVGQFLAGDEGRPLGDNFVVTTLPGDLDHDPVVSGGESGFVIAWTSGDSNYTLSNTRDGSGAGVFAREVRRVPDCGDATDDGRVAATDALMTLAASVGTGPCDLCVCDTDASGELTATDALAILRNGVGLAAPLQCENC